MCSESIVPESADVVVPELPMRTMAFIDAGQFRPGVIMNRLDLSNGRRFDWKLFKSLLERKAGTKLHDAFYFDSIDDASLERQTGFHQFLRNELCFQLQLTGLKDKRRKCPECSSIYTEQEQKGVDVSLVITMLTLAYANSFDQALLCTGDGDFAPLVSRIRKLLGKRVVIFGWRGGIAPQLRDAAYDTVVLNNHTDEFLSSQR